jgi:hypothetical protein
MGFDAFVPNRIPAPLKRQLQQSKGLEFIWNGMAASVLPASRRADSSIFTHVLDEFGYNPPNSPRNLYFFDDYSYLLRSAAIARSGAVNFVASRAQESVR